MSGRDESVEFQFDIADIDPQTMQLVESITHDLSNVFQGVLLASELMERDAHKNGRELQFATALKQATEHGLRLNQQLFTHFAGLVGVGSSVTDALDTIGGVTAYLGEIIGPDVRFEVNLEQRHVAVPLSTLELEQVVVNLVTNAREASDHQDTIELGLHQLTRVTGIRPETEESMVVISVRDSGRGMTPGAQAKLFDQGFTTKGGHHQGIGLATVARIVERVEGFVQVESNPGMGSVVTVYLPAVPLR